MPTTIPADAGPCATCRYWDTRSQPTAPVKLGACRADLPSHDPKTGTATWPICKETDWCKRWVPI